MSRCSEPLRPGDVLLAGTFSVTPAEVTAHHCAGAMRELLAHPGGPSARLVAPPRSCPAPLLVAGALTRLRGCAAFDGHETELTLPVPPRLLAEPAVGEPLTCVATVRSRSENSDRGAFLTLAVELRRPRGRTVAVLEVGVELRPDRVLASLPRRAARSHAA